LKWTRWSMWFCKKAENDCLHALLPQIALRPRQARWECFDFTAALRLTTIIYWLHGVTAPQRLLCRMTSVSCQTSLWVWIYGKSLSAVPFGRTKNAGGSGTRAWIHWL
jgi:hypothetical protein